MIKEVKGKDGVTRGLELKSTSGYTVQRPLELVRDLEIRGAAQRTCAGQDSIHGAEAGPPTDQDSTQDQIKDRKQRRTQRQAAVTATAVNKLIQEEDEL